MGKIRFPDEIQQGRHARRVVIIGTGTKRRTEYVKISEEQFNSLPPHLRKHFRKEVRVIAGNFHPT
jgi:hypothetical protein